MTKFCSHCVVLLLLLISFSVDNVTCTIAVQGCITNQDCAARCLTSFAGGRGYCFKPPIAPFVECRCDYPC
ncbi:hypothetical protein MKW98_003563 [Papaver atlanticum]|uniref:Defensin-like protein n=1 Tax=Papaver atlanticum TaxID=357466 RepID=A0AAD4TBQ8_9MAGN|nr:hypothetical protein MKW98_003563 [Papaver atlanticum]